MRDWKLTDALAAELLAQLEAAECMASDWDGVPPARSPAGIGFWSADAPRTRTALPDEDAASVRGAALPGTARPGAKRREETELPPGEDAFYGWPDAASGGGTALDMASVSHFFERDARRYG